MKLKNILFFIFFAVVAFPLPAQKTDNQIENEKLRKLPFHKRLTFNFGGGLSFGANRASIILMPQVGYRVNTKLTVGVGLNYQYLKEFNFTYQVIGGNVFARYQFHPKFFGQAQYEVLNYNYLNPRQTWNDYLMVGGGFTPGNGLFISGYYLLKYPPNNNIYGSPFILRIGFMF